MENTIEGVKSGKTSCHRPWCPMNTLKDRISGRVEHKANPSPSRYLNENEEKEFADFLIRTSAVGYGRSRRDVMNIAEAIAK